MTNELENIVPFRIEVAEDELTRLRQRLRDTRWPDELPEVGWSYGTSRDYVKDLARYWHTGYDWRAAEAKLNELPQYTTVIDGQRVHFAHVRSPYPDAFPLILTHGWPSTFADFAGMVQTLTDPVASGGSAADAFHLVIPSIPGFGFSGPTSETGWGAHRVALAWAELMARLGYERYGVHGGDAGAVISPEVGRVDPGRVAGVHVNAVVALPTGEPGEFEDLSDIDAQRVSEMEDWEEYSGYAVVQSTRPQTLAFALCDSPTGQLAWYGDWYAAHGAGIGAVDRDDILTAVSQYWFTGTAASAIRFYKEGGDAWAGAEISQIPTGVAVFPGDNTIRRFVERDNRVVRWSEFDEGGHFAALEVPDLLAGDIREFFAEVR